MPKPDEVKLRLSIDVHYELGRTDPQELKQLLVRAAEHLAENGLLSGETEASVLTWECGVRPIWRPRMRKFKVTIQRIEGREHEFVVKAPDASSARDVANKLADDHDFGENSSWVVDQYVTDVEEADKHES